MRRIPLTRDKFAIVDSEFYSEMSKYKWHAQKAGDGVYYAKRFCTKGGKRKVISMHRSIMDVDNKKQFVDHINHDTLDNRVSNLRICSPKENSRNRKPIPNKTSKFLGVKWTTQRKKYGVYRYIVASISVDGRPKHLGYFKTEEEAARAYDDAAIRYYGEFANLNFKRL